MPCYLLHMIEAPNTHAYEDPNVKDIVGEYPRLFCAQCAPPLELAPGESVRCLQRDAPCWKPADQICDTPASVS